MKKLDPDALAVTSFDTAPVLAAIAVADTDGCVSPLCVTDGACTTPWCDQTQPIGA
jgi:hypothetical protein